MSARLAAPLAALALVAGCGGPTAVPVDGTVTLDGLPVTGHIVFVPAGDDLPKRGGAIEAGRYAVPAYVGLVPGVTYRVQVYARGKTGRKLPGPDPEQTTDETRELIPARYNTQTTLTAAPTAGPNTIDFALTTR